MKKIAITGADPYDRTMLADALSYLIGYDVVRHTAYSVQAIKYGFSAEIKDANWQELFIYALSSFSERIEIEQQFENFISNGSVFNELANMKAVYKYNAKHKRENKEYILILSGLEKIIVEYAVKEYDCIIHISKGIDEEDLVSQETNKNLLNLIQDCKVKYHVAKNAVLVDVLKEIIADMNIRTVISPETAVAKVQKDMLMVQMDVFMKQEYYDC